MSAPRPVSIECFFDYSSPWTYLAFSQIQAIADRHPECLVEYRPILVGGIFNTVNGSVYEARAAEPVAAKVNYSNKDMFEWAETYGLVIHSPYDKDPDKRVKPFPVNSVKALRGAVFAQSHGKFLDYSYRVFHAYWGLRLDISQDATLRNIALQSGLDAEAFLQFLGTRAAKDAIVANTNECMQRGGFGSPTFFVNKEHMYFGNDRLLLLERRVMLESGKVEAKIGHGSFQAGDSSPISRL